MGLERYDHLDATMLKSVRLLGPSSSSAVSKVCENNINHYIWTLHEAKLTIRVVSSRIWQCRHLWTQAIWIVEARHFGVTTRGLTAANLP
jgi:hypothetical protein